MGTAQLLPGVWPHTRGDRVRLRTRKVMPEVPEIPGPDDDEPVTSEELVYVAGEPVLVDDAWSVLVLTARGRRIVPIVDVQQPRG